MARRKREGRPAPDLADQVDELEVRWRAARVMVVAARAFAANTRGEPAFVPPWEGPDGPWFERWSLRVDALESQGASLEDKVAHYEAGIARLDAGALYECQLRRVRRQAVLNTPAAVAARRTS